MKYYAILNNYQFGSYPFNTLHGFVTKNVKINRWLKYVELEVKETHEIKWVEFVNKHLCGSRYGTRKQIKEYDNEKIY